MAVSVVFGMTQSGKSYHTENTILKNYKTVIIFDFACCFTNGKIFTNPDDNQFMKILREYAPKDEFTIIIRPSENSDPKILCNKTIELSKSLGKIGKKKNRWSLMVIDEADFVCSSSFQSKQVKWLVNVGRHRFVDSVFIARNPNRIHMDIRTNASKMACFRIPNAPSVSYFKENFQRETVEKIANLPKYWRLDWDNTGVERIINDKGGIYSELLPKSELFEVINKKKSKTK